MGRIQRYAEGFLDLVGNKVGGREPTQLSDIVVPQVDMTGLLLGRTLASEGGISLSAAIGDTVRVTVPDNQVWLLHGCSYEYQRGNASDNVNIVIELTNLPQSSDPINTIPILATPNLSQNGNSNNSIVAANRYFANPWVLTAGTVIQFRVVDSSAVSRSWAGKIGFYRLTA